MPFNTLKVSTYTRTLTGSAIPLSSTSLPVFKAILSVPTGNAGASITVGGLSTNLPIIYAKGASYVLDFMGCEGMRIDLSQLYVNGTNNDVVHVTYWQ